MSDKQAKKKAKEAEKEAAKAAKAAAKAEKKQAKGKGKGKDKGQKSSRKKGGGLLPFGKSKEVDIPMGPVREGDGALPFAIPGQASGPALTTEGMPVPGLGAEAGQAPDGVAPVAPADASPVEFPPQQFDVSQPQPISATGDQYSDQDFGITEVYGISAPAQEAAKDGDARRVVVSGDNPGLPVTAYLYRESTGERRLIDKSPFRVGRKRSEVDFHIAEKPRVSRVHAIITFDGTGFTIRDNRAKNMTVVNGKRLDPGGSVALSDGDSVEMGDESFKFTQM